LNRIEHIDRLYAAVQLLASDNQDASLLFRQTLDGSMPALQNSTDGDQHRRSFYAKLVSSLRNPSGTDDPSLPPTQSNIKARIARDVVDQYFPVSFLELSPGDQLLLFLTSVERYDADSIAEITGFEADHAARQVEAANDKFSKSLESLAGISISGLLQNGPVPREWIAQNFQKFISDYLDRPGPQTQKFIEARMSPGIRSTVPEQSTSKRQVTTHTANGVPRSSDAPNVSRRKWLATVATIVGVGLIGLFGSQWIQARSEMPTTVFQFAIDKAATVSPVLTTSDAVAAERFVRTHFGRIVSPPLLASASLTGVGTAQLTDGLNAPTFTYSDNSTQEQIVVFGLTYGILNGLSESVTVDGSLFTSLEDAGTPTVNNSNSSSVVTWRESDDIFVAVLPKGYKHTDQLF
jgi:hypothetical protein